MASATRTSGSTTSPARTELRQGGHQTPAEATRPGQDHRFVSKDSKGIRLGGSNHQGRTRHGFNVKDIGFYRFVSKDSRPGWDQDRGQGAGEGEGEQKGRDRGESLAKQNRYCIIARAPPYMLISLTCH